jgi:hypothetical protein
MFLKKFKFFLNFFFALNQYFLIFSNHFDVLILKIFKKKHYFDIFPSEKHFKKQPLPHTQMLSTTLLKKNPY